MAKQEEKKEGKASGTSCRKLPLRPLERGVTSFAPYRIRAVPTSTTTTPTTTITGNGGGLDKKAGSGDRKEG